MLAIVKSIATFPCYNCQGEVYTLGQKKIGECSTLYGPKWVLWIMLRGRAVIVLTKEGMPGLEYKFVTSKKYLLGDVV